VNEARRPVEELGRGRGVAAPALLHALIHLSAWNRNSPKFISKILHILTPVPLKTPIHAPSIAPSRYRL